MYPSTLEITRERFGDCKPAGSLLCLFKVSLTTPRYVLALRGREGWLSQLKLEEKENAEVVGRIN